jgi:hypothetical protein
MRFPDARKIFSMPARTVILLCAGGVSVRSIPPTAIICTRDSGVLGGIGRLSRRYRLYSATVLARVL